MPSIVHSSPRLQSRRLAIVSEDVAEQPTGLVNVSIEYVCTAANRDRVARDFYVDAPPPIFPSSVNRNDLQTRQLYMISRTLTEKNGLVSIKASYAGALWRGSSDFLLTTQREKRLAVYAWNGLFVSPSTSQPIFLPYTAFYRWVSVVHNYEYASVGDYRLQIAEPDLNALASLESVGGNSPFQENRGSTITDVGSFPFALYSQSLTKEEADKFLQQHVIEQNETVNYTTPSVTIRRREVFSTPARVLNYSGYFWLRLALTSR